MTEPTSPTTNESTSDDNTRVEAPPAAPTATPPGDWAYGAPQPGYPHAGPPPATPYGAVLQGQQGSRAWQQQLTPVRLAVAGVVLVAAAFLGGFLVGHATAGDGADGGFGPGGGRGGFGQGPGNGQLPGQGQRGQVPGQSQNGTSQDDGSTGQSGTTTS